MASPPSRALVVARSPATRRFLQRTLSQEGFRVSVAATGAAGLGFLKRSAYRILFYGLDLEDVEAEEFLKEAEGLLKNTPRIAVSDQRMPRAEIDRMKELGFTDVVCKPVTGLEVARTFLTHLR